MKEKNELNENEKSVPLPTDESISDKEIKEKAIEAIQKADHFLLLTLNNMESPEVGLSHFSGTFMTQGNVANLFESFLGKIYEDPNLSKLYSLIELKIRMSKDDLDLLEGLMAMMKLGRR
jgi:hypothetical protein